MTEAKPQTEALAAAEEIYAAAMADGVGALQQHFGGLLNEDFEWHPALVSTIEGGRTYVGPEQFADYLEDFNAAFESVEIGPGSFEEVTAGRVLIIAPMKVIGAGSGVPLELDAAYLFEFEAGQAVTGRSFFSRKDAEEFLADA